MEATKSRQGSNLKALLPYLSEEKKHYDVKNGGVWYDDSEMAEPIVSGDYSYFVNNYGRAIITGYSGSGSEVIIPTSIDGHRIIRIADSVFMNNTEIESVSVPYTVTSIESRAFYGCTELTSVTLSENLESIPSQAFMFCDKLASIYIPDGVKEISKEAFYGCWKLSSVTIPKSVTSIGDNAFSGCFDLESVTVEWTEPIPINASTFENYANFTLYVPDGCKAAYEAADYWKEFKEIRKMSEMFILGDATGDGVVDISDYIGVANHILGIPQTGFNADAADVNKDGVIDISDYIGVANIILTGKP